MMLITTSCQKENIIVQKSKLELLTGTRWQLEILWYEQPPGSAAINYTSALFLPCEMDDTFQFRQDGSFVSSGNTIICNPPHTDMFTFYNGGGWTLSQGDTLVFEAGFNKQTFILTSISTTALELKQRSFDYFQSEFVYRFEFKATP